MVMMAGTSEEFVKDLSVLTGFYRSQNIIGEYLFHKILIHN